MIKVLSKLFIADWEQYDDPQVRRQYGVLTGIAGICFNAVLFGLKYFVGILSGSVSIVADAFNNLSDAGSSLITMVGFHFSGKAPDEEHPFGHGRYEYVAGFIVSLLILLMGVELIRSSVDKILHPQAVETRPLLFAVLGISILVKCYMAVYNISIGKKIQSAAMHATAMDSLSDMAATFVVVLSMAVMQQTGWRIDGYSGLAVALFILYTGVQTVRETLSPLLGAKPNADFVSRIYAIALRHHLVYGVHDLMVHDYGAGRRIISLHLEVPGEVNVFALHSIIEHIEGDLDRELDCKSVIHMDPIETDNETVAALRQAVVQSAREFDERLSLHDFRVVKCGSGESMVFDLVLPHAADLSKEQTEAQIRKRLGGQFPQYRIVMKLEQKYV